MNKEDIVAAKAYAAFCHLRTCLGKEGNQMSPLCRKAYEELKDLKRPRPRDGEIARVAAVIDRFWQLHSIEPATGFTPEQLAKEIVR